MSASPPVTPATPASLLGSAALALPVGNQTRVPASVREGGPAAKQAYGAGQGFEEMLLEQLSQSLAQSSGLGSEAEAGGEASVEGSGEEAGGSMGAASGPLGALLPQALTEGVMRGGGIGLAAQLMDTLDPAAASQPASGPTAAGDGAAGLSGHGGAEVASSGGVSGPGAGASEPVLPASASATGGTPA